MRWLILFLLLPTIALAQQVGRYALVLTAPMQSTDSDGKSVTLPAGYVYDIILWDGVSPYTPPCTCEIKSAAGLSVGDTTQP